MKSNLEILLGEWGIWRARENENALGLPKHAAFTTFRVDGMRSTDSLQAIADLDMRRVDGIVESSPPDWRIILIAEYIWPGPVKAKAARLGMLRQRYYELLYPAHVHVGHRLGGKYEMPTALAALHDTDLFCPDIGKNVQTQVDCSA